MSEVPNCDILFPVSGVPSGDPEIETIAVNKQPKIYRCLELDCQSSCQKFDNLQKHYRNVHKMNNKDILYPVARNRHTYLNPACPDYADHAAPAIPEPVDVCTI